MRAEAEEERDAATRAGEASELKIPASDGFSLAATQFEPAGSELLSVVVISPALAAPQRYYRHFASFLAEAGHRVITYDYRGVARSRPDDLRDFEASMRDWGELDMAGVFAWVKEQWPRLPLLHVGHSAGGLSLGLASNCTEVVAHLAVACESPWWGYYRGLRKALMWTIWTTIPPIASVFGYLPGWIGIGESIPAGVAREWAYWGRTPRSYFFPEDGDAELEDRFARYQGPFLLYSFIDDQFATEAGVRAILECYPNARKTLRMIAPEEGEVDRIGHFGYFRKSLQDTLWPRAEAWLRRQLPARKAANGGV